MVLRKVRRIACHPAGLVTIVSISCCMYVYLLVALSATSGSRRGSGDGAAAASSAVVVNGNGSTAQQQQSGGAADSIEAIRERHTRQLWAEVRAIAADKPPAGGWEGFQARVLARAGPPLACSAASLVATGNDNNSGGGAGSGGNNKKASLAACDSQLPSSTGSSSSRQCASSVRGAISVQFNLSLTWPDVASRVKNDGGQQVLPGGAWCPPATCAHQQSLAVIIPFRDRWRQLRNLLAVLHPMLQRQAAGCYRIFVVEQYGCGAFNKGRLNNAGFLEALARHNFTCAVFQDTDIVPENDRNPYVCGAKRPRHLAVAVDTNRYKLPYAALVGGVIAFQAAHFFRVNGYSNLYWGWGLEDDDMELRMKIGTKLKYERPPASVARFKALPHKTQRIFRLQAARRKPLLKTALGRYAKEGLNTVKYRVLLANNEPMFTHLLVDVGEQPLDFEFTGTE